MGCRHRFPLLIFLPYYFLTRKREMTLVLDI
ncbi:hypothetical protein CbuK_1937 [Coxiella burnetii CbuK_Q154]|nr:hypothetical protein CbuK_1937 [Coxiella burnetii CbuK_Q154]